MALNDTLDQIDLTDIFRTFHPKAEYTFFLSAHGTFSKIDHILGHKTALNKHKRIEIIPCTHSDHYTMKLRNQPQEKVWKTSKSMEVKEHCTKESMGQPGN